MSILITDEGDRVTGSVVDRSVEFDQATQRVSDGYRTERDMELSMLRGNLATAEREYKALEQRNIALERRLRGQESISRTLAAFIDREINGLFKSLGIDLTQPPPTKDPVTFHGIETVDDTPEYLKAA